MKIKSIITALCLVFMANVSFASGEQKYSVDSKKSEIQWKGEKVTGEHHGNVNIKSGSLEMTDGKLTGGTFMMDMTSITCSDLKDPETNKKLVGHLKSDDFFGVTKHPTAKLVITKVVPQGPNFYKVTGEITIKGITREITFKTMVKEENSNLNATAEIVIDRSDFNVRYGSGSFFDDLGDKTIYDDFTMKVSLTATSNKS